MDVGCGGEIIETVEVNVRRYTGARVHRAYQHGKLISLKASCFHSYGVLIFLAWCGRHLTPSFITDHNESPAVASPFATRSLSGRCHIKTTGHFFRNHTYWILWRSLELGRLHNSGVSEEIIRVPLS